MSTRAKASLVNTNANVWHLSAADGQHLSSFTGGTEDHVLRCASASLVADHSYPRGQWQRRGPGRFAYVEVTEPCGG